MPYNRMYKMKAYLQYIDERLQRKRFLKVDRLPVKETRVYIASDDISILSTVKGLNISLESYGTTEPLLLSNNVFFCLYSASYYRRKIYVCILC